MRVIAGRLSGRTFDSVPGHRTHPMSEKIRGAIFNALGDIEGQEVLDAYAGTGALGIEAISRGASRVVMIDADSDASRTIKSNIELLNIEDKAHVSRAYALAWSRRHPNDKFDIVILDPPYSAVEIKELLTLATHARPGGLIIVSLPPNNGFRYASSRQQLISEKNYGDAEVCIYRQLI